MPISRRTIGMVTRYSQTMDINAWPACKCWRFVVQCCSSQAQALVVRPCVSKSDMTNSIQMSESCNILPWLSTESRTTEMVLSTNAAHKYRVEPASLRKETHTRGVLFQQDKLNYFNYASNDPYVAITRVLWVSRVNLKCKSPII